LARAASGGTAAERRRWRAMKIILLYVLILALTIVGVLRTRPRQKE
jgi:predicted nucleic acid-binding Zn ribbon protein